MGDTHHEQSILFTPQGGLAGQDGAQIPVGFCVDFLIDVYVPCFKYQIVFSPKKVGFGFGMGIVIGSAD